jgi:hypothetical protein
MKSEQIILLEENTGRPISQYILIFMAVAGFIYASTWIYFHVIQAGYKLFNNLIA